MVSKASDDFPLPESPVKTIILLRGISTDTFFKLCVRAPFMTIFSFISLSLSIHKPSLGLPEGGVGVSTIPCLVIAFNDKQSSEIRLADFFIERIRDECGRAVFLDDVVRKAAHLFYHLIVGMCGH